MPVVVGLGLVLVVRGVVQPLVVVWGVAVPLELALLALDVEDGDVEDGEVKDGDVEPIGEPRTPARSGYNTRWSSRPRW